MMRSLLKIIALAACVLGGAYGIYVYEDHRAAETRLREQVRQLEEQRQHLQDFVTRLTSERRMAELVVTSQQKKDGKVQSTTLLFSEIDRNGTRMPPKFFTIEGEVVHIDSLVIKFERDFIEKNDPLRGHSVALFYRLYGDHQAPADGFPIDDPGQPPAIYQDKSRQSEQARQFELELWKNFWKLADDAAYRNSKGVRLAQGESPWRYVYPDYIYTLSIQADGGLNMTSRPIDELFRQYQAAVKREHAALEPK